MRVGGGGTPHARCPVIKGEVAADEMDGDRAEETVYRVCAAVDLRACACGQKPKAELAQQACVGPLPLIRTDSCRSF